MYESIDKNVNRSVTFSQEELDIFHSLLEHRSVPKKTFLLQEGEVCNFEAYVIKGCVRTYYIDENGFEVILQFGIEDWWLGDAASFNEQTPTKLFIETIEDSELFIFTPHSKEELLFRVPKFERVFRLLIQRNLAATQSRLFHTFSKPAQERYLEFIEKYPTIPQRVPQHYIASYLGISPEFLSKIRGKLAKK
ncbi:MAG: Crp/Fnr family transcriptional regulator [Crocinitomicaceae bacterium]|nr:Crp/Fnr family transcriptional regulator [Crocinitomicaceae bacterium]